MTYNFDPDRWYDNEHRALQSLLQRGEIDQASFQMASEDLYQRYEQMLTRLDGTYQVK